MSARIATHPFRLNLRHLRGVAMVVQTRSITLAAASINLSQPALTQGIAKLELQLATDLFDRRASGMEPTAAGALLATRTDEAMRHLAESLRAIRRDGAGSAQPERLVTMAQLRALLALADGGSYVDAASQTGLSQPAVHRAVRDVERLAEAPLVERRGRGVVLTEAGRRVARGMRLFANAIAAGLADIAELVGDRAGTITIGAMPMARPRLLPEAIARLHRSDPHAAIRVVEGSYRELVELLREGRLDLALGAPPDASPGPDLSQRALTSAQLSIVARADHPVIREGRCDLADLARYPWILPGRNTPHDARWKELFDGMALPPTPIECGSAMTIRGLLLAGDYLTLLSPEQIWVEVEMGLLRLVGEPLQASVQTLAMISRADWRPSAMQRRFIAMLEVIADTGLQENQ